MVVLSGEVGREIPSFTGVPKKQTRKGFARYLRSPIAAGFHDLDLHLRPLG
jgi:hypothetical protein